MKKNNRVISIHGAILGKNNFWYTNINSHLELFNSEGEYLFDFHDLLDKKMTTGYTDYFEIENNLWFTTPIGILKTNVQQNHFNLIHKREDALSNCRGITEDENGNIYFLNRHLYQWKPNNKELKEFSSIEGSLVLINHDNLIWGGINHQENFGFELNLETSEFQIYSTINSYNPYTLLESTQSGIYFAGQEKGISLLDLHQKKLFPFEKYNNFNLLRTSKVYFFHKNKTGIWIASNNGIFLMSETSGVIRHFSQEKGDLPFNQIRHIHEDTAGVFWLATPGAGIIRWQPSLDNHTASESTQFTTENGLSNNHIYAIYGDDYNNLWMPSDLGLMKMNKANNQIKNYTIKDGLPHNEFNLTAHYQAKDGTLYFGGLGGLINFHPKDFAEENQNQTPLVFTNYKLLEGSKKELTDKTNLLSQSNEITFKSTDKLIEMNHPDPEGTGYHSRKAKLENYFSDASIGEFFFY